MSISVLDMSVSLDGYIADPDDFLGGDDGERLHKWADAGVPVSKWYIETLLLPGVPVFARLVFLGEVAAGLALFFGFWVRPAAIVTFLMVLNIHFAHSSIFQFGFLSKGDGLPILAGLLALAIAGNNLPLSLSTGSRAYSGSRKRK